MDRYRTLEGLLIGRKPLPGGDLILSFVTPEGALQAVARKALRPTGRSGRLSLFHHLRFQVYQKPGNDLPTLTQAELVGRLEGLEAPPRFAHASYLGELAFRLASPEVAGRIWPILISGLRGIAKHENSKMVLVWAGWRVLRAAGLQPNLTGQGQSLEEGRLSPEDRGVFLGSEGVQALRAVLFLPGSEAIEVLQGAPLDRLLRALKVHADHTVGALNSAGLL
ncbi:MAG: DNA recombination protein RecO [Meiothermus sp.]